MQVTVIWEECLLPFFLVVDRRKKYRELSLQDWGGLEKAKRYKETRAWHREEKVNYETGYCCLLEILYLS